MKPNYVAQTASPLDRADKITGSSDRPRLAESAPPVSRDRSPAAPPKFDKVAYQREYMRKRRAAAKERVNEA